MPWSDIEQSLKSNLCPCSHSLQLFAWPDAPLLSLSVFQPTSVPFQVVGSVPRTGTEHRPSLGPACLAPLSPIHILRRTLLCASTRLKKHRSPTQRQKEPYFMAYGSESLLNQMFLIKLCGENRRRFSFGTYMVNVIFGVAFLPGESIAV